MTPYGFADLFCGMGAIPYWLLGCKPPISYMGSKVGYADAIAAILGLSRHHRPAAIVLGDVGPTVAVHAGLFGAAGVTARDVAGWVVAADTAFIRGQPELPGLNTLSLHGGDRDPACTRIPRSMATLPHPRAAEVAAIIRGWKDEDPRALWTRLKAEGWPSLLPVEGGRWLGPQNIEEIAAFLVAIRWSFSEKGPEYGYGGPGCGGGNWGQEARDKALSLDRLARLTASPVPSSIPPLACWQGTAARLVEQLPERLESWITYLDPPYSGTTGYPFGDCPREEVLRIALDLHRRGATVAISEAVRLDGELGEGWHAVRIDSERKGTKRTFSVQQSEWLTLNRPPVTRPGVQVGLWGAP